MSMPLRALLALTLAAFSALLANAQAPLETAFRYQGRLQLDGNPVSDTADLLFALWDDPAAGTPVGSPVLVSNAAVVDGLFTVELDFGAAAFNGGARWLEIAVRSPAGAGAFTTLSPRQPLTAAPYALFSAAPWATNGTHVSNVNSGNVGIGTSAPANRLSVAGDADVTGRIGVGISPVGAPLTIAAEDGIALQSWHDAGGYRKWNLNLNPFGPDSPSLVFSENNVNPLNLVLREGGNVGISQFPELTLDLVQGGIIGNSTVSLGQHALPNQGVKVSFGYQVADTTEFAGMRAVVTGGTAGCGNSGDIRFDTWECGTSISREVMRIAGNGRVGIGVDAPSHQLTIQGGADSLRLIGPLGSYGHGARLSIGDADYASIEESTDDQLTVKAVSVSLDVTSGVIARTLNQAWALQIHNQQQATYQAGMLLGNDGFLYITNRINGATGWARLDSAGAWSVASDRSLKHSIEPLDGLLDKALALQPVSYYYNHQDMAQTPHRQIGFVAQDVEPLFPSLVLGGEKKTLNYAGLSVVAIGALQELKREKDAEIEALRSESKAQLAERDARLDALHAENADLAARLAKLEALLVERSGK